MAKNQKYGSYSNSVKNLGQFNNLISSFSIENSNLKSHEKMFQNISRKPSPPPLIEKISKFSRNLILP